MENFRPVPFIRPLILFVNMYLDFLENAIFSEWYTLYGVKGTHTRVFKFAQELAQDFYFFLQ